MNIPNNLIEKLLEQLLLKIILLLLIGLQMTLTILFVDDIYALFENKEMHMPLIILISALLLSLLAFSFSFLYYYITHKPYRMNLFKRFGLLWDMKCKPHCKYCFVLLKDMPLNQPLIHCNICNKPMKIINDKDNKESNLEDCFAKFRKGK